ncbi:MAG: EAL domain-containing protein [Oscillospiraceae bacterium]|nr:EAL domain-containing protein [Oscillospiraceae bacterium]
MKQKLLKGITGILTDVKNHTKERLLLKKIRRGLQNREFKTHLQFIVDNKTKQIVSCEALSRWETAEGEIILPGKYIGVMEKNGLIVDFDYYMFENVCERLAAWSGTEFDGIKMSCNLTRITISEKDFVDRIKNIAAAYAFDKSKLIIEITEDAIEKNRDIARANIQTIKEMGFSVALDDIGSGYTSLISLCEYPIDIVKLDRALLLLADREIGKKLFLGVMAFIQELGLKVVCEGVETEEQNSLISESSCDHIQGWYYSKALSAREAETFAREYMTKTKGEPA